MLEEERKMIILKAILNKHFIFYHHWNLLQLPIVQNPLICLGRHFTNHLRMFLPIESSRTIVLTTFQYSMTVHSPNNVGENFKFIIIILIVMVLIFVTITIIIIIIIIIIIVIIIIVVISVGNNYVSMMSLETMHTDQISS